VEPVDKTMSPQQIADAAAYFASLTGRDDIPPFASEAHGGHQIDYYRLHGGWRSASAADRRLTGRHRIWCWNNGTAAAHTMLKRCERHRRHQQRL